jgi:hypothetical protein
MLEVSPTTTTTARQATEAATAKQQRRALRKLLRDLVAFTGVAASDLAATPRRAPQPRARRLLYRRADTLNMTLRDLEKLAARNRARIKKLDRYEQMLAELLRHTTDGQRLECFDEREQFDDGGEPYLD